MKLKKLLAAFLCAAMVATSVPVPSASSASAASSKTAGAADAFQDLNQEQITAAMGAGWNLGNQLEANSNGLPSETVWGNPVITKDIIRMVKTAGFTSIRVPVSYLNYITTTVNEDGSFSYTIDTGWLNRIKEVVDMCMEEDLYTIINMHGDGYTSVKDAWLFCGFQKQLSNGDYYRNADAKSFPATDQVIIMNEKDADVSTLPTTYTYNDKEYAKTETINSDSSVIYKADDDSTISVFYFSEICNKYAQCWKQIASAFQDYDEHLIYESMNEEFDGSYGSSPNTKTYQNINTFNQVFVDTVREAGGNNDKRWLLIPGWNTNIDQTADNSTFQIPTDTKRSSEIPSDEKRIMISVHYYTPWPFCGEESTGTYKWGSTTEKNDMKDQLTKMKTKFVNNGYPVVIGEFGAIEKSSVLKDTIAQGTNHRNRVTFNKTLAEYSKELGCIPVYWDNNAHASYTFAILDRTTLNYTDREIVDAIVSVFRNPDEVSPTSVTLPQASLDIEAGDTITLKPNLSPASDSAIAASYVTWTTSDSDVATVNMWGDVTAIAPGTAEITASLPNGETAACTITVTQNFLGIKLYAQNSSDWTTAESAELAKITPEGGDFSLSVTLNKNAIAKLTSLYLKDTLVYRAEMAEKIRVSDTTYVNLKLNSLSINGKEFEIKTDAATYHYDERTKSQKSDMKVDYALLNTWGEPADGSNVLANVLTSHDNDNGFFITLPDFEPQDTNTITVSFTASDVYIRNITKELYPAWDVPTVKPSPSPGTSTPSPKPTAPSVSVAPSSVKIGVKEKVKLPVKTNVASVTAASSNTKVATASVSGSTLQLTGKKTGSATVTVKAGTASATVKVKVAKAPKKLRVAKKKVTVKRGKKATVKLKYSPKAAASYNIKVQNAKKLKKSKLTVTATGTKVTIKADKKAKKKTYKVQLQTFNKKKASISVKVK